MTPRPPALEAASALLERMAAGMSEARRARLKTLHIGVVPRDENLADAAAVLVRAWHGDAASAQVLHALRTGLADADARSAVYSGRCASPAPRGATLDAEGLTFCFVGEENLLAADWDLHGSRAGRVAVHEIGHAVERLALTSEERHVLASIHRLNLARRGASARDSAGAGEFFAESGEAWFGVHQLAPRSPGHGPDFLRDRLPVMAELMSRVYGPSA